jgi:hypothetical protein
MHLVVLHADLANAISMSVIDKDIFFDQVMPKVNFEWHSL